MTKHLTITELMAWPKARNKGTEVDRRAAKGKPGTAFEKIDAVTEATSTENE